MQEHLTPETPTTTPCLTITLTDEQVNTLLHFVDNPHIWGVETRSLLLESLRNWVDPAEMTAEEILEGEG